MVELIQKLWHDWLLKTKNFPQNVISSIVRTLTCQPGLIRLITNQKVLKP